MTRLASEGISNTTANRKLWLGERKACRNTVKRLGAGIMLHCFQLYVSAPSPGH
jgi:hypothetical protein